MANLSLADMASRPMAKKKWVKKAETKGKVEKAAPVAKKTPLYDHPRSKKD